MSKITDEQLRAALAAFMVGLQSRMIKPWGLSSKLVIVDKGATQMFNSEAAAKEYALRESIRDALEAAADATPEIPRQ